MFLRGGAVSFLLESGMGDGRAPATGTEDYVGEGASIVRRGALLSGQQDRPQAWLLSEGKIPRRRTALEVSISRLKTTPLGCGTNPLLAQPLPQTAGQLRKNRGQQQRSTATGRRPYLLETDYLYLRISS